jgi:gliding motility-associated-like protein
MQHLYTEQLRRFDTHFTYHSIKSNCMKAKITFLLLMCFMFAGNMYSQFDAQHPDLRLCGSPPNYYLDVFNCTSNNFTLNQVFLSLTNVNGQPINNTTCNMGTSQMVYVMLNYTSNASNTPNNGRLFADLSIDGTIVNINCYLGSIAPGAGQRQIYGPFLWSCGQELILSRILAVWRTGGSSAQLPSYTCSTYGTAQCEIPSITIVSKPLAVQFSYKACRVGNNTTVNFTSTTNGGISPYTFAWDFDGNGTTDSTIANPSHTYTSTSGNTATLTVHDTQNLVNTFTVPINVPAELMLSAVPTHVGCGGGSNGAIDLTATGGTPGYTYSWSNGASSQDLSNLAPGTYTVTVTDANGCQKTLPVIINGGDSAAPVVTAPANVTLEGCNSLAIGTAGYAAFATAQTTITAAQFTQMGGSYTDASTISSVTYQDVQTGTCPKTITRTFRVTDNCNNTGTAVQVFTVRDTTAPVFEPLVAALDIFCPEVPSFDAAKAIDACDNFPVITFADVTTNGQCAGSYSVTRTWTATDACGNVSHATQTITVKDNTAPVIAALPAPATIDCPAVPQFATATATDACGSAFTLTSNDVTTPGQCPGSYSVTRTWTATDACGNASTATQTIAVRDITAPVISAVPGISTVTCPATPQFAQPTALDACGTATLTSNDVTTPGPCAGSYSVTRTWTATDACGNVSTALQTIHVQDTTAPVISQLPATSTISCPAAPSFATATAVDACGSAFTLTFNDVTTNGQCAGSYSVTRTWTATDACGNASTASQTINVQDTVAPVIAALPATSTISCPAAPSFATATAVDACGSAFTLTFNDVTTNGQCAGSYSVTRTWTATDACGNASTASQTINVQDTVAPVIAALPATSTISCPAAPSFATATAVDACGSAFTLTFNDITTNGQCAGSYSVTRTWTATDACGNASTASQTINVQDTVAPVIAALPATSTISCPATPAFATATAVDACGSAFTLTFNDVTTNGQCAGSYSVTRTWTATDACGNASTASQTINVQDTVAPVIAALPATSTISCPAAPSFATATAVDACGSAFTLTFNDVTTNGQCAGSYSVTRTWTATDACGNASTASQTINVQDTQAPVIAALPATSTISCPAAPSFATATAVDACGSAFTLTFNDVTTNGQCAGSYSVTRTWTATDACGNASTASQTINVQDTVAPVIAALPATSTISCPATPSFATATAVDACGSAFTLTFNDVTTNGQCANSYSVTRTWTATDACGNASTASQTINVQDVTAPVISTQASNITVECDGTGNQTAITNWLNNHGGAVATDACSQVTWTNNFNALANDCSAAVTVIFTATDACGNASPTSATLQVQDETAPVAPAAPANVTAVCASEVPANISLNATDNCSGTITAQGVDSTVTGTCPNSFITTRTWTFTDACGNHSSVSQTININDNVAPVIVQLPAASTISCPAVPEFAVATATDNCAGNVTLTSNDVTAPGQCAGSYSVTRTWTATDACGNTSTKSQTINVQDTVAPVIAELPAASTISCPAVPSFATATAVDACGSTFTLTFNDVTTNGQCAGSYSVTRTWTATDACGNSSTASQTISVEDTVAPVIAELPAVATISCPATPSFATATAVDACGSAFTLTFADVTTQGQCTGSYSVTRTWTATDACGNAATASQTINVQDIVAPVITTQASNITVECDGTGNQTAINDWLNNHGGAVASDACSDVTWTNDFNALANDCSAAVTVIFTATDACGNASPSSATFQVQDVTEPVAPAAPAAVTGICASEVPANISLTATDNCSTPITVEGVDTTVAGNCPNSFVTTRTWTFTDACGNTSSVSQTITINDNVAPAAPEAPASVTVACAADVPAAGQLSATDNCGDVITATGVDAIAAGQCANSFVITRTWTFADACGNTSSVSQTINVNDNIAPVIDALPAASTISCPAAPVFAQATASDNCIGEVTLVFADVTTNGQCAGSYSVTRTWTATDACGNASTASQTISVEDTVAPVIAELPAVATISCPATPSFATATAVDACGSAFTLTFADVTTQGQCAGSYSVTRTWTATDACGNAATASQTINVQDIVAPVITTQASNITVECDGTGNQTAINDWLANHGGAVATDACSDVTWTNDFNALANDCSAAVTVIFTATDACGNASPSSATFQVQDVTEPVAPAAPAAVTGICASEVPANISLTATDNCSTPITVEGVDTTVAGNCPNSFVTTRTWTFTDACGNTSSVSQTITINDNVAPAAPEAPASITVACAGDVPAAGQLSATDNCGDVITATGVDAIAAGQCVNSFVITRTWTFADACGNTSSVSQTINVVDDIAPVAPAAPVNVTLACAGDVPAMISLTATDNCDDQITSAGVEVTTPGACANSFVITRTWTFADACGNTSSVSQTINVVDDIAPVAPAAPANVTLACAGDVPAMISLTATDNCGELITVAGVDVTTPGQCVNSFVTTRTWTFTDACGNTSSVSQTINVVDDIAPVAPAAPASVAFACTGEVPAMISLTATDNCGEQITVQGVDSIVPGACPNSFVNTRTWTFTDACGNSSSVSQTITVSDTVPPAFVETTPADITVSCDAVPTAATLTATDNCSANVTVTMAETTAAGTCPASYTLTRTWSATDECGNTATTSQIITVQDTTAPTFDTAAPADISVACDAVPVAATLTATDNCGTAAVTFNETRIDGNCAGTYVLIRTWTATDLCGNTTPATQTVKVADIEGPTANEAFDAVVNTTCDVILPAPALTFSDSCSGVVDVTFEETSSTPVDGSYTIVRNWTATDGCGNMTPFTQTVNVTIANSTLSIPAESCSGDISPIDLSALLPAGTEINGTWVDTGNTGGLTGSTWIGNGIPVATYVLQYIIAGSCPRTINVNMAVNDECIPLACGTVKVYNAFTPGNDAVNDHFHIDAISEFDCYPTNTVEIYNRWGVLVYDTKQYDNATNSFKGVSDGRATVSKGEELPTGTYFFILQYTTTEGNTIKKDGYLYLSR